SVQAASRRPGKTSPARQCRGNDREIAALPPRSCAADRQTCSALPLCLGRRAKKPTSAKPLPCDRGIRAAPGIGRCLAGAIAWHSPLAVAGSRLVLLREGAGALAAECDRSSGA